MNRQDRALTLIELVVVIIIIVLLQLFLLSQRGSIPVRGSRIMCMQHLRQIGVANQYWLMENDERTMWPMAKGHCWSEMLAHRYPNEISGLTATGGYLENCTLICPDDAEPLEVVLPGSDPAQLTIKAGGSYFMNADVSLFGPKSGELLQAKSASDGWDTLEAYRHNRGPWDRLPPASDEIDSDSNSIFDDSVALWAGASVDDVVKPAEYVLFWDSLGHRRQIGGNFVLADGTVTRQPDRYMMHGGDEVHGDVMDPDSHQVAPDVTRHEGGVGNAAFLDGHVEILENSDTSYRMLRYDNIDQRRQ